MSDYKEAYPYICIECGKKVPNNARYFPFHELLSCMVLKVKDKWTNAGECLKAYFEAGGMFGGPVLGVREISIFRWESSDPVPEERLTKVGYSMANLVGAIEMQLNLREDDLMQILSYMVGHDKHWKKCEKDLRALISELERKKEAELEPEGISFLKIVHTVQAAAEPFIVQEDLEGREIREKRFYDFLDALKELCISDPALSFTEEQGAKVEPAGIREMRVGWIYSVAGTSGRMSPEKLYISLKRNGREHVVECTESCCPHCRSRLSKVYGLYRQVTVGVLGGQSTGKTTYLAALTDFIDSEISTGAYRRLPFTLGYERPQEDGQWRRFLGFDENREKYISPKWAYCHGYNVQKTDMAKDSAASLTFLVSPVTGEPVIYVLADIAGEAFGNERNISAARAAITSKHLMRYCDVLFMVMSCDPEDLRVEAARYKEWMTDFPDKNIPAALLLTKADFVFKNGQCMKFGGAVNLRRIVPVVTEETGQGKESAVYNLEAMSSLCRVAANCAEEIAPGLLANLTAMMREKSAGNTKTNRNITLAVFPVSSGTADYCNYNAEQPMEGEDTKTYEQKRKDGQKRRYESAKASRFGVSAPFFWLLALDGTLPCGRGGDGFVRYDADMKNKIGKLWERELKYPQEV